MLAFGAGLGFHFLANRWKVFKSHPEKLGGLPRFFHWLSAGGGVYGCLAAGLLGLGLALAFIKGPMPISGASTSMTLTSGAPTS